MNQRLPAQLTRSIAVLAVAFMLALSLGAGMDVHAQGTAEITITARAGFNNICRQGHWYPVRVQVENKGQDLDDVRILVRHKNAGNESAYAADLALPASSRKQVTLYARAVDSMRQTITVSLVSKGKTLAATSVNLNCVGADTQVIGVIADDPTAYIQMGSSDLASNPLLRAEPSLEDLPEGVEDWETLDVLVISGVDTGTLSQEQRTALKGWVTRGGRLFVVGGPKWQAASAGLGELLPVQVSGTQQVDGLSALASYLRSDDKLAVETTLAVGDLHKDASVLIEQDGIPLLAERRIGQGSVLYLAADPALQPLSEWNRMDDLYGFLFSPPPALPRWTRIDAWDPYEGEQALSTLKNLDAPSALYLLCWLGGYIILIGPANYLLLKRLKRNHLAWISIPALALLFTAIAYVTGGIYRGAGPILNRLAVIQAWEGEDQARVQALVGLYSPSRATYTLEMQNLRAIPIEDEFGTGGSWLEIQDGATSSAPDIHVEAGGMKSFALEGSAPALSITHTLTIQISDKSPQLRGAITNDSPYTLRDALLVLPGSRRSLGDLLPGQSVEVKLPMMNSASGPLFGSTAASILGVEEYPQENEDARRVHFFSSVLSTGYYYAMPSDPSWGIHLMGWLDDVPLAVELDGRRAETIDTTLYVVSLSPTLQFAKGPWRLPPAMFTWEGSSSTVSPYGSMDLSTGGYTLHFKPAFPLHYRSVKSLNLHLAAANYGFVPRCLLWDFVDSQWHQLDNLAQGNNEIPNPGRYVGPNGEVLLKVESTSNPEQISASHVTLVVNP